MDIDLKTPEVYRHEVERLGEALSAQTTWLKEMHLVLFGQGENSLAKGGALPAHRSPFRDWYQGMAKDLFTDSSTFAALGLRLETMETHAGHLAQAVLRGLKFPETEYVEFMDSLVAFEELAFKLQRETMTTIAGVDDLTGIGNEASFSDQIIAERERVKRADQATCIGFTEIGDYGSESVPKANIGENEMVAAFSDFLVGKLRPYDQMFRLDDGGFALCLPYTEANVAELVITRIQQQLADGEVKLSDGTAINITAFFGITPVRADDSVSAVRSHASEALNIARDNALVNVFTWSE